VFADAGGVGEDASPELSRGVGAGMRYRAPVGTLQVDLAHPLDGDERGVRPHIGIRVGL
jgi:translocation and assembly module TamA